ncbi:DUF6484 domain-containing protein [Mesorhizobium sp. M0622]|uniref:DUF6484 domain-containing protein n=1 Tax=unclassified Mesorhizobium TaxID=325217 RepID=UPI0033370103
MSKVKQSIDGVVIGVFLGYGDDGPLVVFPGNPQEQALSARALVELTLDMVGSEVALLFEDGNLLRPLIMGRIVDPARKAAAFTQVLSDGEYVRVKAQKRIELRCGKASIIMDSDGHIVIRGTYVVSHASGANNIRGGSINLN